MIRFVVVVALLGLIARSLVVADPNCPNEVGCRCFGSSSFGYQVDCSNLGLTSIPRNLPAFTTSLDLSLNVLTIVGPDDLVGLDMLTILDLQSNALLAINDSAFKDLSNLKHLYLQDNPLCISDNSTTVSPRAFKPLSNLQVLDISKNIQFRDAYPQEIWKYVPKLEELRMNGIFAVFGEGFTKLLRLHTLSFRTGICEIRSIRNETFLGLRLSPVTKLDLENCNIGAFDGTALNNLPSLSWLSMAWNPLRGNVLYMATGFPLIPLEHLDLNHTFLEHHVVDLIRDHLCGSKLKWLTLSNNTIYTLGGLMSRCFPELEVLSFSNNCVFEYSDDVMDLLNMMAIRVLNMSGQYRYTPGVSSDHAASRLVRRQAVNYGVHICENWEACPITVADSLRTLDLSHNGEHLPQIPELVFMTNLTLDHLLAKQTGITEFTKPFFCRYKPILRELDFRDNSLEFLHPEIFGKCDWSSTLRLKFGGNNLASLLDAQGGQPFFKYLTGLQELDLSRNSIAQLHPDVLSGNADVRTLDLHGNLMSNLLASINHMEGLQLLDLSDNRITCLSEQTRAELEEVLLTSPSLKVNLAGNYLQCSCACLESIHWMSLHQDLFVGLNTYSCTFPDLSTASLAEMNFVLHRLEGVCQPLWWALGALIGSLLWMAVTVAGSLLFRWRFSLEVMWYKPRAAEDEHPYEFDSFVVYNRHDKHWVQNDLCKNLEIGDLDDLEGEAATTDTDRYKLCYHHRDFIIGMHIIDNISDAFDKSRTTLIALSNAALRGNWLLMEMQMAVQTTVARKTNSLLFVFLEPLEGRLVTPQLRRIINTYTCKRWYPHDIGKQEELWNHLRIAMKFPRRNNLAGDEQS